MEVDPIKGKLLSAVCLTGTTTSGHFDHFIGDVGNKGEHVDLGQPFILHEMLWAVSVHNETEMRRNAGISTPCENNSTK